MKKLLPILLILIGIGAGTGAGLMLKPEPAPESAEVVCADLEQHAIADAKLPEADTEESTDYEYVKLNNQFVVPIVDNERVVAMVIIALSLEVPTGETEAVYSREPKLRDAFLQAMFDHANVGGFRGTFTSTGSLELLKEALLNMAQKIMGDSVHDVLITEIARQDV